MLSAADFPAVFPWMAERLPRHERKGTIQLPTASCIARWEDDGGRTLNPVSGNRPPTDELRVSRDSVTNLWVVPLVAFTVPALAVATMAILSTSWTSPLR
jgi:hypothetical protein